MTEPAEIDFLRDLPRPDTIIGRRFRLGRAIGQGGMSAVFCARDQRLEREVAFKILSPVLSGSREVVARFVNEARTLARLDCPHIVRVHDCGVTTEPEMASLPYMVLELLHGADLRTHCECGPIAPERVLSWILQACEGLAAAHAEGVIHRDLKPENLFLCAEPDGTECVKLLDFGIARSIVTPSSLTLSGEGVGSPGYMSPEQLRDASAADERSDIWSLGVVMYELLAGVPPFQAAVPFDLCAQILAGKFPRLGQLCPELPRGLVAVVHRCLAVDPVNRFESVLELAVALAPFATDGIESAVRIRHRLGSRDSGELPGMPACGVDVQAPTVLAHHEEDAPAPLARPRRRQSVAHALAGFSFLAMLALLARAFVPVKPAAHFADAQASVERLSERVGAVAHELAARGASLRFDGAFAGRPSPRRVSPMSQHYPMPGEFRGATHQGADVELLKDFCKEELAAAQAYEKALSLPALRRHADVLGRCYASHRNRVAELGHRIVSLGGEAPSSPGVWGSLVPTLAAAAAVVSDMLAISLLEEAEDRAVRRYREHVSDLEPDNRAFAVERIVPAQETSHAAISQLRQALQS